MDRELKIPFSETLNEIYLELPKFNLNFEECNTCYKKFLYTMNNIDIMGQLSKETIQNDKLLRKLKSAIELQRMSAKERLAYELSIAAGRDLAACMATSFEEGEERHHRRNAQNHLEHEASRHGSCHHRQNCGTAGKRGRGAIEMNYSLEGSR